MPPRPWGQRVLDTISAAERIEALTAGLDLDRFTSDPALHDGVPYNFVVIGKAARYVPADIQARYPNVPWREPREMRNFVAHVYHGVSDRRVWKTIPRDVPHLAPELRRLLAEEPPDEAEDV